jgi:hypothetical protein
LALLSFTTLQKASISDINLAGGAFFMVFILFLTNSDSVSIDFSLFVHSFVLSSLIIYLNSSINIGSIGLLRLFCFLNVFEVLPKPALLVPPVLFKNVYYMLKSDD